MEDEGAVKDEDSRQRVLVCVNEYEKKKTFQAIKKAFEKSYRPSEYDVRILYVPESGEQTKTKIDDVQTLCGPHEVEELIKEGSCTLLYRIPNCDKSLKSITYFFNKMDGVRLTSKTFGLGNVWNRKKTQYECLAYHVPVIHHLKMNCFVASQIFLYSKNDDVGDERVGTDDSIQFSVHRITRKWQEPKSESIQSKHVFNSDEKHAIVRPHSSAFQVFKEHIWNGKTTFGKAWFIIQWMLVNIQIMYFVVAMMTLIFTHPTAKNSCVPVLLVNETTMTNAVLTKGGGDGQNVITKEMIQAFVGFVFLFIYRLRFLRNKIASEGKSIHRYHYNIKWCPLIIEAFLSFFGVWIVMLIMSPIFRIIGKMRKRKKGKKK
ncbi:MAG: hypothetical protein ACTSUE_16690 [Promethearchaeota archaeon]